MFMELGSDTWSFFIMIYFGCIVYVEKLRLYFHSTETYSKLKYLGSFEYAEKFFSLADIYSTSSFLFYSSEQFSAERNSQLNFGSLFVLNSRYLIRIRKHDGR